MYLALATAIGMRGQNFLSGPLFQPLLLSLSFARDFQLCYCVIILEPHS
jgi:hypothetical protein